MINATERGPQMRETRNRRVRVLWSDLNGLSHGRYVPERRAHEHGHHAVATFATTPGREILPLDGYAADVGYPDLETVPLIDARRPGWEPDTDVVVAALQYLGEPLAICPRNALVRAVEAWHALGYEPMLGFEFYVLQPDPDAPGGFGPLDNPGHRVYGTGRGGDTTGLMFDFFDAAEHVELDLEGVTGEFHPGQMEINMRYGPALDAADRAFLCKEMTRELGAAKGYCVTYMGRPIAEYVGSGLHVNFSLSPTAGGPNAFDDVEAPYGLSVLARQCIGGLIRHHEAVAALSAPTINSYKRLIPGIIAGYWANWGLDNRISTYRVPGGRGAATRVENRMPCGSSSPYLAAAAMLNAALLGVVDGIDCGEPQIGDADAKPNTERHTPETLADALRALDADPLLCEAVGSELTRAYSTIRHDEVARWEATGNEWSAEEVTAWELNEYLPFY
jgi:glutamine synthetase